MIDREKVMQRHIHNLKKSAGLHGNGSIKYEYIYTAEELEDAMLKRMDDLGYPLRVEPKRDRFVMNKSALKDAIIKASEKALNEFQHQIFVFVKNDVGDMLEREAYVIWNDVMNLGNTTNRMSDSEKWAYRLGAQFGVAIGNAIFDMVDDTLFGKKNKKR